MLPSDKSIVPLSPRETDYLIDIVLDALHMSVDERWDSGLELDYIEDLGSVIFSYDLSTAEPGHVYSFLISFLDGDARSVIKTKDLIKSIDLASRILDTQVDHVKSDCRPTTWRDTDELKYTLQSCLAQDFDPGQFRVDNVIVTAFDPVIYDWS